MDNYVKIITNAIIEDILSQGVRDMPQNPASQGYSERQIRAFYYKPEKLIIEKLQAVESSLKDFLDGINAGKINFSDIVDDLTTNNAEKPLSAKQGKVLNDKIVQEISDRQTNDNLKVDKSSIADNLTTNDNTKVLSAKQGKVLDEKIDSEAAALDNKIDARTSVYLTADENGYVYANYAGE